MPPAPGQLSFRQVLAISSLRRLWLGQLVSIFGDFLALFAVIGVVSFQLRGGAAQVTMISISYMVPLAVFGPVAGVFVDRWNVKAVMIASDLARAALALALVFTRDLGGIYGVFFAMSLVSSFFLPAQSVTVRTIVPREGWLAANALLQQNMQVTRIVSPAVAGAAVAWAGANACFWFDAASFVFSALMLAGIAIRRAPAPAAAPSGFRSVFADLSGGLRFLFAHAAISFVMVAMGAAVFTMGCFGPLIAIYVRDSLAGGSVLFGFITALVGAGMIAGTHSTHRFGRARSPQRIVLAGVGIIAAAVFLMAAVPAVAFTAAGTFGMGFGTGLIIAPAQTLLQRETPVHLVGRVSSSVMSVISVAQVLGLLLSGALAQALGIRNLFFLSSGTLFAVALAGYRLLESRAEAAGA